MAFLIPILGLSGAFLSSELMTTILNPAIFMANVLATTAGIGLAKVVFPSPRDLNDLVTSDNHDVIFHWSESLNEFDIKDYLVNVTMEAIDEDSAHFSNSNWPHNTTGYRKENKDDDPRKDGLTHGQFNFLVPGLNQNAEGYYIKINRTGTTEHPKYVFNNTLEKIKKHDGYLLSQDIYALPMDG